MRCVVLVLAHAHDGVLWVSVESNGTTGFPGLNRQTFNPPPVLHFAGVHKEGADGFPDSISQTFCPPPTRRSGFADFELIQMGAFSAREIRCGFLSVDAPDFAAAPTSAVMPDMLPAAWRFAVVAAHPTSPLSSCQRCSLGQCARQVNECRFK